MNRKRLTLQIMLADPEFRRRYDEEQLIAARVARLERIAALRREFEELSARYNALDRRAFRAGPYTRKNLEAEMGPLYYRMERSRQELHDVGSYVEE